MRSAIRYSYYLFANSEWQQRRSIERIEHSHFFYFPDFVT